jgi:hypothetical protein
MPDFGCGDFAFSGALTINGHCLLNIDDSTCLPGYLGALVGSFSTTLPTASIFTLGISPHGKSSALFPLFGFSMHQDALQTGYFYLKAGLDMCGDMVRLGDRDFIV